MPPDPLERLPNCFGFVEAAVTGEEDGFKLWGLVSEEQARLNLQSADPNDPETKIVVVGMPLPAVDSDDCFHAAVRIEGELWHRPCEGGEVQPTTLKALEQEHPESKGFNIYGFDIPES